MKNTIITIASVVALAGAANAQISIGGNTYSAGTTLTFNNYADAISGSSPTLGSALPGDEINRSYGLGIRGAVFNEDNYRLKEHTDPSELITWGTPGLNEISDFYRSVDGSYNFILGSSVTVGGTNYNAGDALVFLDFSDAISGNVSSTGTFNSFDDLNRSYGLGIPGAVFNEANYELIDGSLAAAALAWGTPGNNEIADFYKHADGSFTFVIAEQVPEPSSTTLLGLGVLSLLARRKR